MIQSVFFMVILACIQNGDLDSFVQQGLDFTYIEEYDSAKVYFAKAIEYEHDNPLGYFAYAGLFRIYTSDFVTDSFIDSFFYYADKTIEKAKAELKKDKKSAWAHFFIGGVQMNISSLYIEQGNYLKALGYAEQSMKAIRTCLEIEPDLFDAYLVLGSYEYLKGSFPLWSSFKRKGIEKIRIASEKSSYSKSLAKNILAIMLQREGRFDESIEVALELVTDYPESRTFRWTLCKVYLEKGSWIDAIDNYEILLENISEEQPGNIFNSVQAKLALAQAYFGAQQYYKTTALCGEIIDSDTNRTEVEDMVKEAENLLEEAKNNM
ncbi:MAG: hypothetical protein E3J78_08795 [Candidatus Cloacimonadota bacterium]|nr:MAG: hypothetical protein E3J78_08795 [Candidatus Cloacimonadota bacterium]